MDSCLHVQWILEVSSVNFKVDASWAHSVLSDTHLRTLAFTFVNLPEFSPRYLLRYCEGMRQRAP